VIIDVHTHIFADDVRRDRAAYFPGEPAFEWLYRSPQSKLIAADELVAAMDRQGVDVSVVFGFPWNDAGKTVRHNNYVMEAVTRYPDRLIGLCCLNPLLPGAVAEIERCLAGGLCGVGELAFYQSDWDDRILASLDPVMALCRERDLPVLLHTNEPVGHAYPGKAPMTLSHLYGLIERFQQNRLVLAIWGGGIFWYMLMKKEVSERLANVWFDTAASPYLYRPDIYRYALALVGEKRLLFGSDFPLLEPERYFREMRTAEIPAEAMVRICGANAAELFGWERS